MNTTAPVPRPSQPQSKPEQWNQTDLDLAAKAGRHDDINAARNAGQLADLLAKPNAANIKSVRIGDRKNPA